MNELIARLEGLVACAIDITLGDPAAAPRDETSLMEALKAACSDAQKSPVEMIPVLEQLEARLDAALPHAPGGVKEAASDYRFSIMKWRPDPPPMPRAVTGFIARDVVQGTRRNCIYYLAKANYESLRRPGVACDCAARIAAAFLYHAPEAPLEEIDSWGAYPLVSDALYRCKACGTKWREQQAMDDLGSRSTWTLAPADATKA